MPFRVTKFLGLPASDLTSFLKDLLQSTWADLVFKNPSRGYFSVEWTTEQSADAAGLKDGLLHFLIPSVIAVQVNPLPAEIYYAGSIKLMKNKNAPEIGSQPKSSKSNSRMERLQNVPG